MLFAFNFCITYMHIHNFIHIILKVWYITIILYNFLLCAVLLMQGFVYEKNAVGELELLSRQKFPSQEMKKTLH